MCSDSARQVQDHVASALVLHDCGILEGSMKLLQVSLKCHVGNCRSDLEFGRNMEEVSVILKVIQSMI